MTELTLFEIAEKIGGKVDGDGEVKITGVAAIEEAGAGDLTFVDNPKYEKYCSQCKASAIVVGEDLGTSFRPLVRTENPYLAFTRAMEIFNPGRQGLEPGIHPSAVIEPLAEVSTDACIMANVVIDAGAVVEAGAVIYPGVVIEKDCRIGQNVLIYPNVTLNERTILGKGTIVHSGVILGARESNFPRNVYQGVEIAENVEIGANGTILSGHRQPTQIGRGTKIDNLVHIDHDVVIGEDTVVVAMVTIDPEVVIGSRVTIAGQVGIARGVRIGDQAVVGARSMVTEDVPEGRVYSGIPAIAHDQEKRIKAALFRLPKLYRRVQQIEELLSGSAENDQA